MMTRTKAVLVGSAAVLALAGVGAGVAVADSGPTSPTTSSGTPNGHPGKHPKARSLLARTEHGEVTVRTKTGAQVVDLQRGEVTAVSPQSITVKSADGFTATYVIDGNTKVRKGKQQSSIGDVHTDDRILVVAIKTGGTETAKRIADAGPA